ncbi:hypothetical protein [Spirosoma fluviale]|uniref:hypothetical protein n=1 Tax=Spirosoma fluviale TaxID=1597977 RepID=UPI000BE32CAE|nr:hypothetical protein [Spirosoma fluviale]
MKTLTTWISLLVATAGFAQQSPINGQGNSVPNIDNMPVLKGRGSALAMPTRNGKGEATPMPNRPMPVPTGSEEQVATRLKALGEPLKHWPADSLNWLNPAMTLPGRKN